MFVIIAVVVSGYLTETPFAAVKRSSLADSSGHVTASATSPLAPPHPPRIICLTSDSAELLILIGAKDLIVGIPDSLAVNHPQLIQYLPNACGVGVANTPDIETILNLHPDLIIIASALRPSMADRWEAAGIQTLVLDCHKAADLPVIARTLGNITGHNEGAERYAGFTEKILTLVHNRLDPVPPSPPPRIYMESYTEFYAYGNGTGANDLLRLLHGINIAADLPLSSVRVSPEWIIEQDPDMILKTSLVSGTKTLEGERMRVVTRTGFSTLRAVKEDRVYLINADVFFSPQAAIGTLYLAKTLYLDRFIDIDPDAVFHEYAQEFLPGADQAPVIVG